MYFIDNLGTNSYKHIDDFRHRKKSNLVSKVNLEISRKEKKLEALMTR